MKVVGRRCRGMVVNRGLSSPRRGATAVVVVACRACGAQRARQSVRAVRARKARSVAVRVGGVGDDGGIRYGAVGKVKPMRKTERTCPLVVYS